MDRVVGTAEMEAIKGVSRQLSALVAEHFHNLVASGLIREEALPLARDWQLYILEAVEQTEQTDE